MQITLPDDLSVQLHQLAAQQRQSFEQFVAEQLRLTVNDQFAQLPAAEQAELQALRYLSDDALRTIAAEQMAAAVQKRMAELMASNSDHKLSPAEQHELTALVERGDQLMLRKAEAAKLLHQRLPLPYTIEIHKDDSDSEPAYVARVVELPGCLTQADTFDEA